MSMKTRALPFLVPVLLAALPAAAQSPNNAALTVVATDPSGAVVPGAAVTVTNTDTGAVRAASTASDGTATVGALPLTGHYRVSVAADGFTADDVAGLVLRAGEAATVQVKLVLSGARSEVTVFG